MRLFAASDYEKISILEKSNKGWLCEMATKPTTRC
jgi:hypothetical protein